jgi:hypothetical protein
MHLAGLRLFVVMGPDGMRFYATDRDGARRAAGRFMSDGSAVDVVEYVAVASGLCVLEEPAAETANAGDGRGN